MILLYGSARFFFFVIIVFLSLFFFFLITCNGQRTGEKKGGSSSHATSTKIKVFCGFNFGKKTAFLKKEKRKAAYFTCLLLTDKTNKQPKV